MLVQVVKSKIHRVKVTGADLNYIGSITIDEDLMDAANIIEGERVQIVNNNNGERLETYAHPRSSWKWRNYTKWCCSKTGCKRRCFNLNCLLLSGT